MLSRGLNSWKLVAEAMVAEEIGAFRNKDRDLLAAG